MNQPFYPFEKGFMTELDRSAELVVVPKGTVLAEEGKYMQVIPLLTKGSIRVFRQDLDVDRELLVYYIPPGETCMMSLVAGFGDMKSQVNAVTETDSEMYMIPIGKIREWQIKFESWNGFIIQTFMNRYAELLDTMNDLSFQSVEVRLRHYLSHYRERTNSSTLRMTHQGLANELGTARVVISRILKKMEREEKVELRRGMIKIRNEVFH